MFQRILLTDFNNFLFVEGVESELESFDHWLVYFGIFKCNFLGIFFVCLEVLLNQWIYFFKEFSIWNKLSLNSEVLLDLVALKVEFLYLFVFNAERKKLFAI